MCHKSIENMNPKKIQKMITSSLIQYPLAAAARLDSDEEPADDEAEDHEIRDNKLRQEATSLAHLTLHDRKNPF